MWHELRASTRKRERLLQATNVSFSPMGEVLQERGSWYWAVTHEWLEA
jgi:hypothetical protein